jgi:hypothetical protein
MYTSTPIGYYTKVSFYSTKLQFEVTTAYLFQDETHGEAMKKKINIK